MASRQPHDDGSRNTDRCIAALRVAGLDVAMISHPDRRGMPGLSAL
jgi:hypothetical protein